MRAYRFYRVDVFADDPLTGNPLAVFPEATGLSDAEMQAVAAELNLSETTFVLPPTDPAAAYRVRIRRPARIEVEVEAGVVRVAGRVLPVLTGTSTLREGSRAGARYGDGTPATVLGAVSCSRGHRPAAFGPPRPLVADRPLLDVEQAMPGPARAQQPGLRGYDGTGVRGWRRLGPVPPPGKPRARRTGVGPPRLPRLVFDLAREHIDQGVAHFAGGRQGPRVVAVGPDPPLAPRRPVDRPGGPDGQSLDTADQRLARVCLDEQVEVVGLRRGFDQAELWLRGLPERLPETSEYALAPEGPEA